MNQAIRKKSIRGIILILFFIIIAAKSCMVRAQGSKNYSYYGYEISVGAAQQILSSNLQQLNNLKVNFYGFNLGGMMSNECSKLKANVGMYNSSSSGPYEIDMIRASISGNIYPLKFNRMKAHLFEPYAVLSVTQQVAKIYGNMLSENQQIKTGSTTQAFLGNINSTRVNAGAGIELQLENNDQKFVHVFAEFTYGARLSEDVAKGVFSHTQMTSAMNFNLGVNFGITKIKRYYLR